MRRATRVAAIAAVTLLGAAAVIFTLATGGGGGTATAAATGDISSREYGGALVALLVLGFIVLGADWQDWL